MTETRKVTKRNGTKEEFQVSKIRKVTNWACEELDVSQAQLENSLDTIISDNIDTKVIHENLIHHAKSFISLDSPDWSYVAGRLNMQNIWKEAFLTRKLTSYGDVESYIKFVKSMIFQGKYFDIFQMIPEDEFIEAYKKLDVDVQRDHIYDYAGSLQLQKKYLFDSELPQEMYATVAIILGYKLKQMIGQDLYKKLYDSLSLLKISLATPILLNLRRKNGNLSSCFTLALGDATDSIMSNLATAARISKNGGGLGVCVSAVRSRGSMILGNYGASNGVTPFIKLFNDCANAFNQLNARAGAFTIALDVWHNDILEFLDINTENGDLRLKSFDIFPQVILNDVFMEKVDAREEYYTFCPHEVKEIYNIDLANIWGDDYRDAYNFLISKLDNLKIWTKHKALDIFKKIMMTQIETGLPYLAFRDTINRLNPNQKIGMIKNVNLCVESFSNTVPDEEIHVCNLNAINLSRVTSKEELAEYVELATYMLDALIEITNVPTALGEYHNKKYRTIGVGILGLADHLAFNKLNYTTGKKYISELMEEFAYAATNASMKLCKEYGLKPFEAYEDSILADGMMIGKDLDWFKSNSTSYDRWVELSEDIKQYGIRNSQVTAIMPTTSTSLLQGCTASFLPPYKLVAEDKNTNKATVLPRYIKTRYNYYQANLTFDQLELVDIVADCISPWIDTGISFELAFDLNNPKYNAPYIMKCIMTAWKKDIKTIYYIRTKSIKTAECESCAS